MKKLLLTLFTLSQLSTIACSCAPFLSFCETKAQFPHDITLYGKIISSSQMNIKMLKMDLIEGVEHKDTIVIWNDTLMPTCDSMLARDLGNVGDTLLILLNRIDSVKNSWDIVGDYYKPFTFCTQTALILRNDTLRGNINQTGAISFPPNLNIYSNFAVSDVIAFLKSNQGDCLPIRDSTFNYIPFPVKTAIWVDSIGMNAFGKCFDIQTEIVKDTVIQGTTYQKYKRFEREWSSCVTLSNTHRGTYGYVRNDSTNRKVWLRLPNSNRDTLMYDFDLKQGDLVPFTYLMYNPPNSVGRMIDSVRFEFIGNRFRRVYYYTDVCGPNPNYTAKLIEGIGDNNAAFFRNDPCFLARPYSYLACHSQFQRQIYPDTTGQCDITISIQEEKSEAFNIFPNPTIDGTIYLNDEKVKQIEVYSPHGQLVNISRSKNQLTLPNESGVYLLRVTLKSGLSFTKKLIRE